MFIVRHVKNGVVMSVDSEWDYHDGKLNWQRAFSFLPINPSLLRVYVCAYGDVNIDYTF